MEVKLYTDPNGNEYREIISRRYQELVALAAEYVKRGARIWINPFDICEGKWALTVLDRKAA